MAHRRDFAPLSGTMDTREPGAADWQGTRATPGPRKFSDEVAEEDIPSDGQPRQVFSTGTTPSDSEGTTVTTDVPGAPSEPPVPSQAARDEENDATIVTTDPPGEPLSPVAGDVGASPHASGADEGASEDTTADATADQGAQDANTASAPQEPSEDASGDTIPEGTLDTVESAKAWVEAANDSDTYRARAQALLDAERAGADRNTLTEWLESRLG